MFAALFNQLPQQIQVRSATLAAGIGLDPVLVFFVIGGGAAYILILIILVQIHEKIIKKRKHALEAYTFTADSVIYEIQKGIYNNEVDSTNGEWIKNRDSSQKYTSIAQKVEAYAEKISPKLSKSVSTTYETYVTIKHRENILGYFLVIVTIGAYKLFW